MKKINLHQDLFFFFTYSSMKIIDSDHEFGRLPSGFFQHFSTESGRHTEALNYYSWQIET